MATRKGLVMSHTTSGTRVKRQPTNVSEPHVEIKSQASGESPKEASPFPWVSIGHVTEKLIEGLERRRILARDE